MRCFMFAATAAAVEGTLAAFNREIFQHLGSVADSDHFSKIKMAFHDKCPLEGKRCTLSSCSVPKIRYEGKDGYINLQSVVESFSPGSPSAAHIWKSVYEIARGNPTMERMVSGLHFSVTTHLAAKHTKLFNIYFSHPLLFKKRFKKEYYDNFQYLYTIIRAAMAELGTNGGEVPESAKLLSARIRAMLKKEVQADRHTDGVGGASIKDHGSSEEFTNTLPVIGREAIEPVNEMIKHIACLDCPKCKLWGTIQVKGMRSAIKVLNGMPLFRNEVIFLVNLFRQMSITVVESQRLGAVRYPRLNLLIICHRQILMLSVTVLALVALVLKLRSLRFRNPKK